MSRGEVSTILAAGVVAPFAFALLFMVAGNVPRVRRFLAGAYAVVMGGLCLALLHGFLNATAQPGWGSLVMTPFSFPLHLMLNLVCVAAVLYAGFRKAVERPSLLMACIPAASGLAALALLSDGLPALVLLWEGVSALAILGLLAQGSGGIRRRLLSMVPWLAGDVLFVAGAVLCGLWLDETTVFIEAPLTSGTEAQVVVVVALFLAGALIRLGVFPFSFWVRDVLSSADPAWSAFFMGAVNFLLAGSRLLVAAVLLARLVAGDWSTALVIAGLVSVLAGPALAIRERDVPGYLSGMYTLQAGFLLVGVGLFSRVGIKGALFCLLVSPLFLSSAMMAAGTVGELRGTGDLYRRGLSARRAPAAFIVLLISGMSLAGLPPMDGFVGKAVVTLGNADKAAVSPFFALAAAAALAGFALGAVAVIRALGGIFTGEEDIGSHGARPALLQSAVPIALCGGSLLLGLFPGLLVRNFTSPGSMLLFPRGFTGPGVVFRGAGGAVGEAVQYYLSWSEAPAAFALLVAALTLAVYFASRAAHPSGGRPERLGAFTGGSPGDYSPSMEPDAEHGSTLGRRGRRRR